MSESTARALREASPRALEQATRQQLREEIDRLRTELGKYISHEPTITEEMAHLSGKNDRLEEIASTVTEHKFLIKGHGSAEHGYILARRYGMTDQWGVIDDTLGSHRFWSRSHSWEQTHSAQRDAVYPWTEQDARRIARMLAGQQPLPSDRLDLDYLKAQVERIGTTASSALSRLSEQVSA